VRGYKALVVGLILAALFFTIFMGAAWLAGEASVGSDLGGSPP
jgi:hypothetical protein